VSEEALQQIADELRIMNDMLQLIAVSLLIPPDNGSLSSYYESRCDRITKKLERNRESSGVIWRYP
jgi:hypothetical protein